MNSPATVQLKPNAMNQQLYEFELTLDVWCNLIKSIIKMPSHLRRIQEPIHNPWQLHSTTYLLMIEFSSKYKCPEFSFRDSY